MADLKTNYVDDVLDSSKNQLRKYQQIQNDDGTVSFVDVTEYSTTGTSFGAKDINDTNAAVNELNNSLSSVNNKLQDKPQITVTSDFLQMYVVKRNGITQLHCPASKFKKAIDKGNWTVIGNIAVGYRPITDIYALCNIGGTTLGIIRIQTDGNVVLVSNVDITTSYQAFFSVLYL